MKKIKLMLLISVILATGMVLVDCKNDEPDTNDEVKLQGNILILQAYGSTEGAEGATHSFVELYNKANKALKLDGVSLYFASGFNELGDLPWNLIKLNGTIPAKGSFLILGKNENELSDKPRYKIDDGYGDINTDELALSNRSYKVALIIGEKEITADNPFNTDGKGKKIAGYIDMVGAVNDASKGDSILGFEGGTARCSASEAVRRRNLTDTNDNSFDFIAARYASGGMSDLEFEVTFPRNAKDYKAGWNPFEDAYSFAKLPPTAAGAESIHAKKLLILQAGAADDGAISHCFVELYNIGDTKITLDGITLQYAAGTKAADKLNKDKSWDKINLTGEIEAGHSFLIRGKAGTSSKPNLDIKDADIDKEDFVLSNRGFKIALIEGEDLLTVQNPFKMNSSGAKAAGYIDMVGVVNDASEQILGLEGTVYFNANKYRITKQASIRRINGTDTDNNSEDFVMRNWSGIFDDTDVPNDAFDVYSPKTHSYTWGNPFETPVEPVPSEKLMILQANTYGNVNGLNETIPALTGGGFPNSLVELYNNTNAAINLTTGNYYLHIGNATVWTSAIKLSGTIPAKSSFLIISSTDTSTFPNYRAPLPTADQSADFAIINNNFKIALIKNQSTLSVNNPFTESSLASDYVDMLGCGSANGIENEAAVTSRPQGPRRRNLTDTDNNKKDFAQADYRGYNGIQGTPDSELYKIWPRNSAAGKWNPMTGEDD